MTEVMTVQSRRAAVLAWSLKVKTKSLRFTVLRREVLVRYYRPMCALSGPPEAAPLYNQEGAFVQPLT